MLDRLPRRQQPGLADLLVDQRIPDRSDGVEVLHLHLGAQGFLTCRAQRAVDIHAQRTISHAAAGDPQPAQQLPQGLDVERRLVRRAQVGSGDDLYQGQSGAVVIDEAGMGAVLQLAGVLLQMQALDAHQAPLAAGPQGQGPIRAQGPTVLADLIALGQIGIEVVLAFEAGGLMHLAAQGQAQANRQGHRLRVGRRQGTGQAQAGGAAETVGLGARGAGGTGAEHLAGSGQLHMRLQADDQLVAVSGVVGGHRTEILVIDRNCW